MAKNSLSCHPGGQSLPSLRLPSQQFADLFSPPSQGAAMVTGRPVTNNGFGFLPGRAPEAAPYRHMPLSRAPSQGWPGGIYFFSLLPSWSLPFPGSSCLSPSLACAWESSRPGAGIPVSAQLQPEPLPPGTRLGTGAWGCLQQTVPGSKVGGPTAMLRGMYLTRNGNLQRRHTMKE